MREFSELKALALEGEAAGELRIGTITTALLSLLPDVLANFAAAFPHVKVLIRAGTSMELYETLQRGDLDVAICLLPAFALPKAYDWHLLREEAIVVLAHSRLANQEPHELLRREPFIRYDRSLGGGKQANQYLRAAKIVPNELFELNSLMAIAMMVDRGLGVSARTGHCLAFDGRARRREDRAANEDGTAALRSALAPSIAARTSDQGAYRVAEHVLKPGEGDC